MCSGERPNVLMIMVDSLRPDRLGCGGLARAATPHLDRLASSGAFLRDCFCPMPSSVPSRASIFTGRWPHSHGVRTNDYPLPASETLLAELLGLEGYRCVAVPRLDPGLERGFVELEPLGEPVPSDSTGSSPEELAYHTTLVTDAAERAMEGLPESGDWFLWVDYESTHEPWFPPEPYRSMFCPDHGLSGPESLKMHDPEAGSEAIDRMRAMYDAEVALVDKNIGRLLGCLSSASLSDSTLIVLLSDHGVFLGEGGFFKKPPFLLDPLIRSTFMVSLPGLISSGSAPLTLAHICDAMPTVLGLLGIAIPTQVQGIDLTPVLTESVELLERPIFVEFCEYRGTAVKCVRTREWKFIYNRSMGHIPWSGDYSPGEVYDRMGFQREMLFNLSEDPTESNNLVASHPAVASSMKAMLIDWLTDTEQALVEKE